MKELELNISNVLIDKITLDEFEKFIYQEFYVDQIKSNDFIYNVININYRSENWKKELEKLIYNTWGEIKCLTYIVRNYCIDIIEAEDENLLIDIVDKMSSINSKYDYEYGTLVQFYLYFDEYDLIACCYSKASVQEILTDIKSYAQQYIKSYNLNLDVEVLLNLEKDTNKPTIKNISNIGAPSSSSKKVTENKKWFQFWK